MFEKKRMHPAAILANALKYLKEAIMPIIFAIIIGGGGEDATTFELILRYVVPSALILLTLINGFISWFRFTYWIEEDELRIEHGLFVRKKRYIPIERIQSISTSEGLVQRLFKLVKVSVETAGGGLGETEAELVAIRKSEADNLEKYIHTVKKKQQADESTDDNVNLSEEEAIVKQPRNIIYTMSIREVLLVAVTGGGALGVVAAVGAFLSQFDELIPIDAVVDEVQTFIANGMLSLIFIGLFVIALAYLIAIVRSVFKYADFTVEKSGEDLIVSHGLLEKKKITVPIKRIYGVKIQESLIRGLFGYASVYVINAGGTSVEGPSGRIMICPFIKRHQIASIIEQCIPEYSINETFHPVPKRAMLRYIYRPMISLMLIVPVGVGIYFLYPWGLLFLLAFPIAGLLGYRGYLFAGWSLNGQQLALRTRFINAETVYMFKNHIQSLEVSRSFWQRRKSLGSISATVLAGFGSEGGTVVDIDEKELRTIYSWYSRTNDKEIIQGG